MKIKTYVLAMTGLLFKAATAILTNQSTVTMSSVYNSSYGYFPGYLTVDNNFDTYSHTACSEVPWLNIQLAESAIVRTVAVIMRQDDG